MLVFCFIFSLVLVSFSYFIYPLILILLKLCIEQTPDETRKNNSSPSLTLIITAYNEINRIEEKIINTLELDYPKDKLEIIVASDCSDDGTDDLVRKYQKDGIKLVRADQRLGKEHAQLCAIREAKGEILVFSDVATNIPKDSLNKLINHYQNPSVGAISSEDRFISQDGKIVGEGLYVKYEMWLRNLESSCAGLVGLSGSFFSCRKNVAENWDIHTPSDFNTALNCAKNGLKAITAADVLGYYKDLSDSKKEYQRKVRTILRGINGLSRHTEVMNPLKYKLFAFEVFSHKLMRWLVPAFLLLILVLNLLLLGDHLIFTILLIGQFIFYGLAITAHYKPTLTKNPLIRIIYFFVQVNFAIAHAIVLFLKGEKMATWQPSKR